VYQFFLRAALLMGLAVHCVGNPLKASELAIQGGSSTGGSSTMVVGQAGGLTLLSATGAWQDRVRVVTSFGVDLDCSIGELSTLPNWVLWPLERTSSTKLRDGQTRVMLHGTGQVARSNFAGAGPRSTRIPFTSGLTEVQDSGRDNHRGCPWQPLFLYLSM
jgi:hypothetical protein